MSTNVQTKGWIDRLVDVHVDTTCLVCFGWTCLSFAETYAVSWDGSLFRNATHVPLNLSSYPDTFSYAFAIYHLSIYFVRWLHVYTQPISI